MVPVHQEHRPKWVVAIIRCSSTGSVVAIFLQITTISILRNSTSTDNELVNALSLYLSSITNLTTPLNASTTFSLGEIDALAGDLTSSSLTVNSSTSLIFSFPPKENPDDNSIVLGGSFKQDQGGRIVDTENQGAIINTNITIAAVFTVSSVLTVTSMRLILISDSTAYAKIDTFTNRTIASSIATAKLRRNNEIVSGPLTLNLYFQVLPTNLAPQVDADFLCAFFDNTSSRWNDSGCTKPTYNASYARHECVCDHLSSFALVWLPRTPQDPSVAAGSPVQLKAVDIASLVFQSLSIACFLGVVIHGTVMRVTQPNNFTSPRNLFPLLSCAVTMVLFIFYIALSMTVYTRHHNVPSNGTSQGRMLESRASPETTTRSSSNADPCLPHENSLAFFTYFLIILMFCIKTGSGYLNYEHFVRLFPPPKNETTDHDVLHFISHLDFSRLVGGWSPFQPIEQDHKYRGGQNLLVHPWSDSLLSHYTDQYLSRDQYLYVRPCRSTYDLVREECSKS